METTAFFDGIAEEISKRLGAAEHEITAAVAWFTDSDLFEILCRKAGLGCRVRCAMLDDPINLAPGKLNFQRLKDIGGEVFLIPCGSGPGKIMHNKFCVIDANTVIMGSYNWTKRAQGNDENIVVLSDAASLAADYLDAFDKLLDKYTLGDQVIDPARIRRRLEIVRNLLLLGERETLADQIDKLQKAAGALDLDPLLAAVSSRNGDAATVWIDNYLQRATALVRSEDHDISLLRLKLSALEIQITALEAEKVELERLINAFVTRSTLEIGDLLTRYLKLRADKLRRQPAKDPESAEATAEAERARTEYEDYRAASEETRRAPKLRPISPGDIQLQKRLYREASQKCHPDKVTPSDRDRATELFTQLNAAYKLNDLATVRAIHAAVREGTLFVDRAKMLTQAEALGHEIARLQPSLDRLQDEIHQLLRSDAYLTLRGIDNWDDYFEEQRIALEIAIREFGGIRGQ
jgi:hypothetical protein